jgi:hypothetical protein
MTDFQLHAVPQKPKRAKKDGNRGRMPGKLQDNGCDYAKIQKTHGQSRKIVHKNEIPHSI